MSVKPPGPAITGTQKSHKTSLPVFILSALLLVILIVSFVLAPALSSAGQGLEQGLAFGRYGSQEISYRPGNFFAHQLDRGMEEAASQGYDLNTPFIAYTLWLRAFRAASQYAVLLDSAQRANIDISEEQLMQAVRESGYFSRNGVFNPTDFNNTSPDRRQSIINEIRNGVLIGTYQNQLTQDIVRSKAANTVLLKPDAEQRNFRMAIFDFNLYPEEKVRAFATEYPQLFQQIEVKRILIRGKKQEAIKIYSQLANAEKDFLNVFIENSREEFANEDISAREGELGSRFYYQIQDSLDPKEDLEKIFSLQENQFSPPLRYQTKDKKDEVYAIYLVTKPKYDINMNDARDRETVLNYLITKHKGLISDYFIGLASEIKPVNFAASILKPGRATQSEPFGMVYHLKPENLARQDEMYYPYNSDIQQFLAAFGKDYQDIASVALKSREFFFQAFSLAVNQVSDPIVLDNAVLVLQLIDKKMSEPSTSSNSSLDFLLKYFLGQYMVSSMVDNALESPRYKDNFMTVYAKHIEPYMKKQAEATQSTFSTPPEVAGPAAAPGIGLPSNP